VTLSGTGLFKGLVRIKPITVYACLLPQLGVRLLDRNTRSLKLTEAGVIYVGHWLPFSANSLPAC
jgi:hypothetical protein